MKKEQQADRTDPAASASAASKQILFVCTGNICRSPMAEVILRARLGQASDWKVASAGVAAINGEPASEEAVVVCRELGLDLRQHGSQPVTCELMEQSRWVVVMTEMHREILARRFPAFHARIRVLKSFGFSKDFGDIPDPIGGSLDVYRTVRDAIESAISDLVIFLMEQDGRAKAGREQKT
ncbi:MAG: low molecular weight protein arginine phosphatase [Kiritimatiellaeota bacterium]|nr:low molecular weight protein arginine phosphatase [Kiritimatiellota bacterium]